LLRDSFAFLECAAVCHLFLARNRLQALRLPFEDVPRLRNLFSFSRSTFLPRWGVEDLFLVVFLALLCRLRRVGSRLLAAERSSFVLSDGAPGPFAPDYLGARRLSRFPFL